ncbi:MAG: efflux RND transporter permease subunit, partial [Bacteroidales bacterium]
FHILNISLNIISLSGLILGMGMIVDNSIIVIDNIFQKWKSGMPLRDAIAKAVGEVFTPMLSSVLTTCSVFLPLIFLSGTAGALFYDQAMAVTVSLFASLLVAVLVLPVYFYLMYRHLPAGTENRFMAKFFTFNYYRPYEIGLKWTLRYGRLMIICFLLLIPLTYFVYQLVEKSRLPKISHDDTILTIDWNSGISLEENDLRVYRLLALVDSLTLQTTSMVGVQQFLMSHTKEITPSESVIYIKAPDAGTLTRIEQNISDYMASNYPKAQASFQVSGNIFNMIFAEKGSPLVAQLYSKEGQAPTVEQVTRVVNKIKKALPGVQIPPAVMEQNIRYMADVEAMALHEVTFGDVYAKMKNMISQNTLFRINQGGYSVPVTTGDTRAEASDILSGKVRNRNGIEVPLSMIIRETKGEDFKKLYSGSGGDYYPIALDVDDHDARRVMDTVEEVVKEDKDFFVTFTGEYFSSRETIREMILILLVAISLLYFILAAQFESVIQPLIILSEIVVDIFFVLLGLWLFGESLNIMSMIGLVVMSGIIINDSILKVDTINRLRKTGMPLLRAVFTGGHSRLKPIIMTSLTTILAIAPFLNRVDMGSDLQYPLSLSIIIGMSVGTVVSLFFIPLIYYMIYHKR